MALASLLAAAGLARAAGPLYAYVSNAAEGSVSVLDLRDDTVVGTVKTGQMGAHGIAASLDGRYGFAALESANDVVVINGERLATVARIRVPFSGTMAIHGLDISPDGKYLWVGARQGGDRRSEVVSAELAVINTATRAVEKVLQTGLGVPSHYAMTPDGKELWIASTTVDLIWIVDTDSRQGDRGHPARPAPADGRTARRARRDGDHRAQRSRHLAGRPARLCRGSGRGCGFRHRRVDPPRDRHCPVQPQCARYRGVAGRLRSLDLRLER